MACTVVGAALAHLASHGQEAVHVDLRPVPRAAARAREFVTETAAGILDDDQLATAHLLVSELVTNGILYGRTTLRLGVSRVDDELLITVQDGNDQLPPEAGMPPPVPLTESGRGMALVQALAAESGASRLPDERGKVVWFTVHAQPQPTVATT